MSLREADSPRPTGGLGKCETLDGATASLVPAAARVRVHGRRDLLRIGEVLAGTYEIRALLGQGGMGQVYEAQDRQLNRRVAIKVPWPDAGATVRREAQALAALRHPSTIGIYALIQHEGIECVVMERVYGVTLEARLERRHAEKAPLHIDEVIDVLAGIAEGLAVVHRAGMAHRDIKPSNVMLAPGNRIVLTDFGLFQPEIDARSHGRDRDIAGSPPYIAPETITNSVAPGEAYLVDIYALGVVAFELLTGKVPFWHESVPRLLSFHLQQEVPDLTKLRPDVPPRLAALVKEMLAKDPKARPQSAEDIAWQLVTTASPSADERMRVVIAEDDPFAATILTAIIRQSAPEAEVHVVHDGREALEHVRRRVPDLLVIDLHLPKLSGVELCAHLRGRWFASRCAVFTTSAHAEPGEVDSLRNLGFDLFVPKGDALSRRLPALVAELRLRRTRRRERTGIHERSTPR